MTDSKELEIAPGLVVPKDLVDFRPMGAGGPGGQHVNRSLTAVQLRFDLRAAPLPEQVKQRLSRLAGNKMTADGILVLAAREHRSAHRNRQAALARLRDLVEKAMVEPARRRSTRPTRASQQERLNTKKRRADVKTLRRKIKHTDSRFSE